MATIGRNDIPHGERKLGKLRPLSKENEIGRLEICQCMRNIWESKSYSHFPPGLSWVSFGGRFSPRLALASLVIEHLAMQRPIVDEVMDRGSAFQFECFKS